MPSIKPAIRKKEVNTAGECRIKIRIVHKGGSAKRNETRYISTDYYIDPFYMKSNGNISDEYAGASQLNAKLANIVAFYRKRILENDDRINMMTCQDLCNYLKYSESKSEIDFFSYADMVIFRMKEVKSDGTSQKSLADNYGYTLKHLEKMLGSRFLLFKSITVPFLKDFEYHLQTNTKKVNVTNSIAVHMRNIRALLNRAIDDGVTGPENYPFRTYHIKKKETEPRPISLTLLRKLINIRKEIPGEGKIIESWHKSVDMFLLSFYLIGINTVDLSKLTRDNINNGRLIYERTKTKKLMSVLIEPEAKKIIKRYAGSDYLLNLIECKYKLKNERTTNPIDDIKRNTNKNLKTICEKLKIKEHLTMSSSRYTWSTIASKLDINDSIIDRALGHRNPYKLAPVYTRYEKEQVDKANRMVIDFVLQKTKMIKS